MKASELRIGNIVKIRGNICKVTNISDFISESITGVMVNKNGNKQHLYAEMNDIESITITEELLLKLGFKKVKDISIIKSFHYENEKCWIYLIENGFEFELITLSERHNLCKTIQYVHQLQNLYFALTGQELIINL